jgi:dTDP-4-amino-4,6-dideoxygalactose transaminase
MNKKRVEDLAIFGGSTLFTDKLHVGRPNIGDRQRLFKRIDDMLDRRWLTNDGPYVQELEAKLAEFLGVKHLLLICNGTVALEIASRALGLHGEVIVPSFTFIATAHALQWQEITPVFCDVGPNTHHIDPERIEHHITPRTSGIMGVHVWGRACDTEAIEKIGNRHNLPVIYDAAHAFGCSSGGKMIGNFGRAEVFSFHATKFFNTFEGGAIATNDGELAQKIRYMRNFGFATYDRVQYIGINGKMSEISAAMGLTLFESLDEVIATNQAHYQQYREAFAPIEGVRMFQYDEKEKNNYQYIILEIDEQRAGIDRDMLVNVLQAENILARRYFYPGCHEMEPYRSYFPHAGLLLPNTNRLTRRVLSLPTGTAVSEKVVGQISDLIGYVLSNAGQIAGKLGPAHSEGK